MKTAEILMADGIMPNLKGFEFLVKAIEIAKVNQDFRTCKVYEEIGKSCNSTATSIERGIRHAITHSCKIKPKIMLSKKKIDNSTYISYVAYCSSHEIEIF